MKKVPTVHKSCDSALLRRLRIYEGLAETSIPVILERFDPFWFSYSSFFWNISTSLFRFWGHMHTVTATLGEIHSTPKETKPLGDFRDRAEAAATTSGLRVDRFKARPCTFCSSESPKGRGSQGRKDQGGERRSKDSVRLGTPICSNQEWFVTQFWSASR